jgi:hypothetical protein
LQPRFPPRLSISGITKAAITWGTAITAIITVDITGAAIIVTMAA